MLITPSENNTVVNAMIIVVLVLEFGALLLSVRSRSLFGFFVTLSVFSGSIGGVLMINAARDAAGRFTPYQSVKGVETWRATKTLFWANIDPSFIEAFIVIAIVCAIPASVLFVINGRRHDIQKKRMEKLMEENALLKQSSSKRTPAKTAPVSGGTSSPRDDAPEETAKSRPQTLSPARRNQAHSQA